MDASLIALVSVHVLGAAMWVGGQLALLPMTRALRDDRQKMREIARRAQPILWVGFALAAATGILLWRGPQGLLAAKVVVAILTGAAAATHTINARRRGPAWVTGVGAAIALLGSFALVVLGAALRWS